MVEKRDNAVSVKLSDAADGALEALAAIRPGTTKGSLAAELIERALLGEIHSFSVAAQRFMKSKKRADDR